VFKDEKLLVYKSYEKVLMRDMHNLHADFPWTQVIVSASGKTPASLMRHLRKNFPVIELTDKTKLPFVNKYKTPKTLGRDRMAAVAGAQSIFPKRNCLVIDIGTCITYDIIDQSGVYWGGNISPGVELRLKAMHSFTSNLPLVNRGKIVNLIGNTTSSALQIGATGGVLNEMRGFIDAAKKEYKGLNVILTGGDAHFFADKFKTKIFVNPNLVLIGLNQILKLHE
jgi:type III pantothenate kinase